MAATSPVSFLLSVSGAMVDIMNSMQKYRNRLIDLSTKYDGGVKGNILSV